MTRLFSAGGLKLLSCACRADEDSSGSRMVNDGSSALRFCNVSVSHAAEGIEALALIWSASNSIEKRLLLV